MKKFLQIIKVSWVVLCILVLLRTLVYTYKYSSAEIALFGGMLMTALSFPAGYLIGVILGAVAQLLDNVFSLTFFDSNSPVAGYFAIFFTWGILFIAGYLQWFILLPFIVNKLRALKNKIG